MVDALKALACQLIVWHHLAYYGPMADSVHSQAPGFIDVLRHYALLAVPVFLSIGGFLAARTLSARSPAGLSTRLAARYVRLVLPYLPALAAAIAAAFLARSLAPHPENPSAPGIAQVLAHTLLLQDLLGYEALSAGAWYVAMDFQLFSLLALLAFVSRLGTKDSATIGRRQAWLCGAMVLASLFWANLDPSMEVWALYFFGAYGMGVFAEGIARRENRIPGIAGIAVVAGAALMVEWRLRILVAAGTAVLLAWTGGRGPRWFAARPIAFLGDISYGVFLIHYPVALGVGAIVSHLAPGDSLAGLGGMSAAWLLSIAGGATLHATVERGLAQRRWRPAAAAVS